MIGKQSMIKTILMYIAAFWLLWEWLSPLKTVSDTGSIHIFMLFVAGCFVLYLTNLSPWVSFPIKVLYIFYMLNSIHFETPFLSFGWATDLVTEVMHNSYLLINARFTELTDAFRTLLFFILLWITTYLLRYWLFVQKRLLLFYFSTAAYIAVLDTFTPYQGKGAIVRLVLFGFLLMGWLHYEKFVETERLSVRTKKWLKPFIFLLCISLIAGYTAPKLEPQWPDPVPFLKSYANSVDEGGTGAGEPRVKKIGYGTNDSQLGGPFIQDDTVVFSATVDKSHYWRVETKDIYTGKGWEATETVQVKTFKNNDQAQNVISWWEGSVEKETLQADLYFSFYYSHLVYPQGLVGVFVRLPHSAVDTVFHVNPYTEKIYSRNSVGTSVQLEEYKVNYEHPIFSVEKLKQAPAIQDGELLQRYTQLPSTLPARVKELAQQITAEKEDQYEKVKAVEGYFRANGYFYDTEDVAIPGENDDYVDQFLFETKRGYCDNFSTAMIVLLRSVGIPARWVKGYTSGQLIKSTPDGKRLYEITNNNAHSWVEVYFAGTGWVPFEPTTGFNNPYRFTQQSTQAGSTPLPQNNQPQQQNNLLEEEEMLEQKSSDSGGLQSIRLFMQSLSMKKIVLSLLALVIFVLITYTSRRKWWPFFTILLFKFRRDEQIFIKAYLSLLRHLNDYGLKRKNDQTLRDYAAYVDEWFASDEMSKLTLLYEKAVYRKEEIDGKWEEIKKLWENLIKKTVS